MSKKKLPTPTPLTRGPGAVYLKDWITGPTGLSIRVLVGNLEIFDQSQVGITRAGDSSWAVRVHGKDCEMVIPGCQIRCVYRGKLEGITENQYWVL